MPVNDFRQCSWNNCFENQSVEHNKLLERTYEGLFLGSVLQYDTDACRVSNPNTQTPDNTNTEQYQSIPIPRLQETINTTNTNTSKPTLLLNTRYFNTNTRCQYWCWYMPRVERVTLATIIAIDGG